MTTTTLLIINIALSVIVLTLQVLILIQSNKAVRKARENRDLINTIKK